MKVGSPYGIKFSGLIPNTDSQKSFVYELRFFSCVFLGLQTAYNCRDASHRMSYMSRDPRIIGREMPEGSTIFIAMHASHVH